MQQYEEYEAQVAIYRPNSISTLHANRFHLETACLGTIGNSKKETPASQTPQTTKPRHVEQSSVTFSDDVTNFAGMSTTNGHPNNGEERNALIRMNPPGSQIRHPPPPHELDTYITPDDKLFQMDHMGGAVADRSKHCIVIGGLVERPLAITLEDLKRMPQTSITAVHECYGSPLKPPTEASLRIGNARWTGVKLSYLLGLAGFKRTNETRFIWSEGLDCGTFAGVEADRYQKDLPMAKALKPEVLVAYEMNGEPLRNERGGPARLVVPGFFGTNSTKWLCRLSVRAERASSPYTTTFYNEQDPRDPSGQTKRPVWDIEVNSIIVRPRPNEVVRDRRVQVEGWAWSPDGLEAVAISCDGGETWIKATVDERFEQAWQRYALNLEILPGHHTIVARAMSVSGDKQPLLGRRNHVHRVEINVEDG